MHILTNEARTRAHLDTVLDVTNRHTHALGFLPIAVYRSAIDAERLWIATDDSGCFMGHLLFGGVHPTLKVVQLYVDESARRRGVGRRLIETLVDYGEAHGYGSIRARVADDLEANAAWQQLGFVTERRERGGRTTGRRLAVRFRRLAPRGRQMHFLSLCDARSAGPATLDLDALRALGQPVNRTECFTLDLNVWLDVSRAREPHVEAARLLLSQASRGRFRLWFTTEFQREALRTSRDPANDPLLTAALTWPCLRAVEEEQIADHCEALRRIVFPARSPTRRGAENDESDLRHLAISIVAGAAGFVTRERALLRARDVVRDQFGFEIMAPVDLLDERESLFAAPLCLDGDHHLRLSEIAPLQTAVNAFIDDTINRGSRRLQSLDVDAGGRVCLFDDIIVGVVHWDALRGARHAELLIAGPEALDEDMRQRVFDILLGVMMFDVRPTSGAERLSLLCDLETQGRFDDDLRRVGFFPTEQTGRYVRFMLGAPLTVTRWSQIGALVDHELAVTSTWLTGEDEASALRLEREHERTVLARFDFETRFGIIAPTLGDRSGWYVPIQSRWREQLLPLAEQTLLFRKEAVFRIERVYFYAPRGAGPAPGDIILFYISRPTSGVIGMARCTASVTLDADQAAIEFGRQAVLDPHAAARERDNRVHCLAFDNYTAFTHVVPRRALAELGVLPGNNLVTTSRVPGADGLRRVIDAGFDAS